MQYQLSHFGALDAKRTHLFREAMAEAERPVLPLGGAKDSGVMLRLATKGVDSDRLPFPVMHVDTGHSYPDVVEFRDRTVGSIGARMITGPDR